MFANYGIIELFVCGCFVFAIILVVVALLRRDTKVKPDRIILVAFGFVLIAFLAAIVYLKSKGII